MASVHQSDESASLHDSSVRSACSQRMKEKELRQKTSRGRNITKNKIIQILLLTTQRDSKRSNRCLSDWRLLIKRQGRVCNDDREKRRDALCTEREKREKIAASHYTVNTFRPSRHITSHRVCVCVLHTFVCDKRRYSA